MEYHCPTPTREWDNYPHIQNGPKSIFHSFNKYQLGVFSVASAVLGTQQ